MLVSIASAVTFANITNLYSNNVSVIDAATNTAIATVNIRNIPF
jgi:YVTN family beta-propeller protein